MSAAPTAEEREAVDRFLDVSLTPPESPEPLASPEVAAGDEGRHAPGGYGRMAGRRHLLLPALHAVSDEVGWISRGALNYICERLIVPPAEAYGVASFYALLSLTERPRRTAHVCDDVVCRRAGGLEILDALRGRDDVHSSPCLGQCDRAPAVFVQRAGRPDLSLTGADPEQAAACLETGEPPADGAPPPLPQRGRPGLRLLRRVGAVDPASLDDYRRTGGYRALRRAVEMGPQRVIEEVKASNLRGRGGAAFPAGVKWEAVARSPDHPRYLICNADESEPGTFKDRVLMEGDPFALAESMTIAGLAIGAEVGYLYIRAEYPLATQRMEHALAEARRAGLLGEDAAASGSRFDIEIRRGGGAYICGEETALMNSIEGKRGEPRNKPPFPTVAGLFGKPTVINNVETLVNIPEIALGGGRAFASVGTPDSTGTKLFCLAGDVKRPGVYEVEFGETLGGLLQQAGVPEGGAAAVLLGGAAGTFVGPDCFDMPLTFEGARARGAALGSGVVCAFGPGTDFRDAARRIARFFRDESCGQCVPCRVGTVRQEELLERRRGGGEWEGELFSDLAQVMGDASICGLGHTASSALGSAVRLGLLEAGRV